MERRTFLNLLAGAMATAAPYSAYAQRSTTRSRRVAFLALGQAGEPSPYVESLRTGLREFGWIEGNNLILHLSWATGRNDMEAVARELLKIEPDVVVTQLGVDTFHDDPLAHGELTTAEFITVLQQLKTLAPRWIATGGGGYNLTNVARAWTLAWGIMNGVELPDLLPEESFPLLQQAGYGGRTLRDPASHIPQARHHHLRVELQAAIAYLERHVFPIHGIR